ncbi:MAG: hypothetical protein QOJ19_2210 [Acidimicrobiia bacterium]|jgi:hypothetical protein|nr:hypothetical protein [Acidimicrobiia bacterium]
MSQAHVIASVSGRFTAAAGKLEKAVSRNRFLHYCSTSKRPCFAEWEGTVAQDNRTAGIGVGGILVIIGIIVAIVWSFWLGLIIALVGLIAFGGFAKGKWY